VTEETPTPEALYAVFRERRAQAVTMPQGNLALLNTSWFYGAAGEWESVWGAGGEWAAAPAGEKGVLAKATAADGVTIDGKVLDGEAFVHAKNSETPSSIEFADGKTGTVIVNEEGVYALRVWDAQSDDILNFGGIDAYDYNPAWVINATFIPIEGGKAVGVEHLKDEGNAREKTIPGDIVFTHDGTEYTIAAFVEGRALMLVFSDATNGNETYSVGRFLLCAPNPDGTITLDFNRAFLPPCAFSYNFNCSIPPEQNRFPFKVEAGEKNVLAKSGELLH
jgi:uncharacterized protein (DUF1684 family)